MIQRISPTAPQTIALIVAAGEGLRMGGGLPKQYRKLHGTSVLRRSVETFLAHPAVDEVRVVIHPSHSALYENAVAGLALPAPIHGGATRQVSVRNGLLALQEQAPRLVLVHDAARCLIDAATITRTITALAEHKAVLPVLPVVDTLKRVADGAVAATLPREGVYSAQTPQGFDYATLLQLHLADSASAATDDASLAEAAGLRVECVAGHENNFKLTREEDWMRAESLLTPAWEYRSGSGFDVHKLVPFADATPEAARVVHINGIAIPHSHALEGHSDADVGLHALVDAILGALALGDIGTHFPPSDARWKGADSAAFVTHACELMAARGAKLVNADITLICEAPKVGPHRDAMRERVAALLNVPLHRVSVKATTSETLGFTGRREGIAAQAIVSLALPNAGEQP